MKTVLVLEDDRHILDFLCLVLTSKGYAALEAGTAEEALRHAEKCGTHVDLLIADVVLTVSTGIRVAVQLKRSIPELKIILTSGYPPNTWSDQSEADLGELPLDSVTILRKPFSTAILLEKVHRLIGTPTETPPNHMTAGQ